MVRYYRKIIKITGDDSPNVQRAKVQIAAGLEPDGEVVLPGVLTWQEYQERRSTWSERRQCVGLDAEFWRGKEDWLFPAAWLAVCKLSAARFSASRQSTKWMGIDPAEGGDTTSWTVLDRQGIVEQVNKKTANTDEVPRVTLGLMGRWGIKAENVGFDRGGGGQQHADRMRAAGHNVRSIAFGTVPAMQPKRGMTLFREKVEVIEEKSIYKNLRAQMYDEAAQLCDPSIHGEAVFGIPAGLEELHRQLRLMPRWWDEEGKMYLPPKHRKSHERDETGAVGKVKTLDEMLGCSPDEADSFVLGVHVMLHKAPVRTAGAY